LNEVPKLGVEEEDSCLTVPKKLGFDRKPRLAGGGVAIEDGVGEVVGDRPGDPRPDDIVHAYPVGDGRGQMRRWSWREYLPTAKMNCSRHRV
jgi:hypothetical protein